MKSKDDILQAVKHKYDGLLNRTKLMKAIESVGFRVIEATDYQLQLDIDDEESYRLYTRNFASLVGDLMFSVDERYSGSGSPHRHITINLNKPLCMARRILLQALLGSDVKREYYNYVRMINNITPNILFIEGV